MVTQLELFVVLFDHVKIALVPTRAANDRHERQAEAQPAVACPLDGEVGDPRWAVVTFQLAQ